MTKNLDEKLIVGVVIKPCFSTNVNTLSKANEKKKKKNFGV